MTEETVREHFKDAKIIKNLFGGGPKLVDISDNLEIMDVVSEGKDASYWIGKKTLIAHGNLERGMYADIVECKNNEGFIATKENNKFIDINSEFPPPILSFPDDVVEKIEDTIPKRYSSRLVNGMDVIDLIKHWSLNFNEGNILKYLLRDKGEDIEDMGKIEDYAKREKEYLKNK